MRITDRMLFNQSYLNLTSAMERYSNLQEQMSTGKRINKPSDSPGEMPQVISYRTKVKDIDQYTGNINYGLSWLSIADNSLSNVASLLNSAKSIALGQSNATADDQTRRSAARQIDSILNQIVQISGTKHGNRYLFSGHKTNVVPFEKMQVEGKTVVKYNGDDGAIYVPISSDINVQVNKSGKDIFGDPETTIEGSNVNATTSPITTSTLLSSFNSEAGVSAGSFLITNGNQTATISVTATGSETIGDVLDAINNAGVNVTATINDAGTGIDIKSNFSGATLTIEDVGSSTTAQELGITGVAKSQDVFGVLIRLKEALLSGDTVELGSVSGLIDSALDEVLQAWVDIGSKEQRFELTRDRLGSEQMNYSELLSDTEDADLAELVVNLSREQSLYQGLLKVTAGMLQPSLLDFLR